MPNRSEFRRRRWARVATGDLLDQLEAEHQALDTEEQLAANARVDSVSDDLLRADLAGRLDEDPPNGGDDAETAPSGGENGPELPADDSAGVDAATGHE